MPFRASSAKLTLALSAAAITWCLAAAPGLRAQPASGAVPSAVGMGRLVASGTLTAVDPGAGTVTLAIAGTGRLERYEGGTTWRQGTMSGSRPVRLLPMTLLLDAESHPIALAGLHAGESASLWAVVGVDSSIRALTLQITSPRPRVAASPRADEPAPAATGVVIQRSGQTLVLLTSSGARRSVVTTPATLVRSSGRPLRPEALALYDVLRVTGVMNSDGSVAATRIDVDFATASGATVAGPVQEQVSGLGGLVVDGTMVCTSADTYVISRNARGTAAEIVVARSVTIYGTLMKDGSTPVGLEARVVIVR